MRHFRGFASPPRCTTFVALHMSHCELCKCKWESFMTNQSICCDSALASSVLADAETYFWIDFSQGESVAESGSIIRHYFRTLFIICRAKRVKDSGFTFWTKLVALTQSLLAPHSLESGRSQVRIPLAPGFFRVESYQWLKNWHPNGYPARRLAL